MKFTLIAAIFAATAVAIPTGGGDKGGHDGGDKGGDKGGSGAVKVCSSTLFSNPQCCATDVLGVIGLDCSGPSKTPTSKSSFVSDCAARGQQARCCVLPVAGQNVLCQPPV